MCGDLDLFFLNLGLFDFEWIDFDVFVYMDRSKIRYLSTEKLRKITGIDATNHFSSWAVSQKRSTVSYRSFIELISEY